VEGVADPKGSKARRWIEILASFTAPPIVGLAIVALVMSGAAPDDVTRSGAATSTALIVGALLLVVPAILYAASPHGYADHQRMIERRLSRVADAVEALEHATEKKRGLPTGDSDQ
jgi:hypothetical protein